MNLKHPVSLYIVGIVSSFTSMAAIMVMIGLSTWLVELDPSGEASSLLQTLFYLGVGVTGLFGGWILQRFGFISIGFVGPVIASGIAMTLAFWTSAHPYFIFSAAFLLYLLAGLDHPNNLRFYRENLGPDQTARFFSLVQTVSTLLSFIAPVLAGFLIAVYSPHFVILLMAGVYLVSALPWLIVRQVYATTGRSYGEVKKYRMFEGFIALAQIPDLRVLNISRLIINLAYVSWLTALPIVIALQSGGDEKIYARNIGLANGIVCGSFAFVSLIVTLTYRQRRIPIKQMAVFGPLMGALSVVILSLGLKSPLATFSSAIILGIGTYCFRISGMTIGQKLTPKELLGPVIIAGDALVRTGSFLISLVVIALALLPEPLFAIALVILVLPALTALRFLPQLVAKAEAIPVSSD